jgi:hypothetical protein
MGKHNLIYLHRNVDAEDADTLVLRTAALEDQWKDGWEQVVAQVALAAPVVVFAGLGTEVGVLIASALRVKAALSETVAFVQVDIGTRDASPYAVKLGIDDTHFVSAGWSEFMRALGERVARAQARSLKEASELLVSNHGVGAEATDPLLDRLVSEGLLYLGTLRAKWALEQKPYASASEVSTANLADLLLAVAMLERLTGCEAHFVDDGLIELRQEDMRPVVIAVGTGLGVASWLAAEARLRSGQTQHTATGLRPTFGLLAHVKQQLETIAAPTDIVAEADPASIVTGPGEFPIFELEKVRAEPADALTLVRAA